jgi:hypothetical protein
MQKGLREENLTYDFPSIDIYQNWNPKHVPVVWILNQSHCWFLSFRYEEEIDLIREQKVSGDLAVKPSRRSEGLLLVRKCRSAHSLIK